VLGAADCSAAKPVVVAPGGPTIPGGVVALVHARWKNGRIITDAPGGCPGDTAASPVLVGDLNGDGRPDYAFRVSAKDGTHLVSAITRLDGFTLVTAPSSSPAPAEAPLSLVRRGQLYRQTPDGVALFFGADTLASGCGPTRTGYFWTGSTFDPRSIILDAAGAPLAPGATRPS
jgi:hypothetical protein